MTDEDAWNHPAERETVADTVTMITALVEPDADENRVSTLVAYLLSQDYTEAEIRYAAQELPKDEHLDAKMRYGKPLTPADFERVINRSRKVRAKLRKDMDRDTMIEMIEMEPALSRDDFGERHDNDNKTVYTLTAEARKRIGLNE